MAALLLCRASRRSLKPSLCSLVSHSISYQSNPNPTYLPRINRNPSITTYHHFIPSLFNFSQKLGFSDLSSADETSKLNKSDKIEEVSQSSSLWIDLYLPEQVRPYAKLARLDKPIGTWLLAWPSSPGSLPDVKMLTLFGCGALLLRGAGCTINDLLDRDIDTKHHVGCLILAACLLISLDEEADILGNPVEILSPTFNWGALLGWSAIKGNLDPLVVLPLYISGVCWTLIYDTIYAHQDKEDDLKVGVKSMALRFGESTMEWITGFGAACIASLAISGYNADIGWPFYASLPAASMQLGWQVWTVDLSSGIDCNRKFVSNEWFGALTFSGILFGRLLQ